MTHQLLNGYLYKKRLITWILAIADAVVGIFARRKTRPRPTVIKKILIVKPDHLGDCVISSSALKFLKTTIPDVQVDYLAGPWGEAVLKNYPEITRIWSVRHAQHNRKDRGLWKWWLFWQDLQIVLPKIRAENYDVVLFLRAFGGNLVFTGPRLNAKFLAGHGTGGGAALLDACVAWKPGVHETEHYAEVLRALGFEVGDLQPYFPSDPTTSAAVLPDSFMAVHPGAGAAIKKLRRDEWLKILSTPDSAGPQNSLVVCGSPDETTWIKEMGVTGLDLTNRLSIPQLFEVFNRASEIHVLDSFPAHLAAASRCPRVVVHFRPSSDAVQWRPLGPAVEIVQHPE